MLDELLVRIALSCRPEVHLEANVLELLQLKGVSQNQARHIPQNPARKRVTQSCPKPGNSSAEGMLRPHSQPNRPQTKMDAEIVMDLSFAI